MSGCGRQGTQAEGPATQAMQGRVQGGQQAVVGATIALYAAGATGYGSAASSLLSSSVTSGAGGSFSITGLYTCPSPSTQVYIVASGGNPGSGANSALAMMAALGSCGNLSASTFININELTTVAAVYALAQFMATNSGTPGASLGTSSTNATGLANAFVTASNLVNTTSGLAPGASLPSGASVPAAELNTLADILAFCINSNGSTGECASLFTNATPSGGSAPQNTIDAALDIALNPSNNVTALYQLLTATPPFQPTLSSAPNDWTLAINYSSGGLSGPTGLVVDSSQNIWVANNTADSLTELSNSGSVLSGSSGYTGGGLSSPRWMTIDTNGGIWATNANNSLSKFASNGSAVSGSSGYTGGGLNSPQGMATYLTTRIFAANNGSNAISSFFNTGSPASVSGYTGAGLSNPYGAAVGGTNLWATNGNNSISKLVVNGSVVSGSSGYTGGGLSSPRGIALDSSGNAWIANQGNASVSKFGSNGVAVSSSSGYTGGGLVDPSQIAVDGLGNVWVTNPTGNCLSKFDNSGTAISGSSGYTAGGLGTPGGLGIDGSGNVWVANTSTNQVTELVGAAAPVVTPLSNASSSAKIGQRP